MKLNLTFLSIIAASSMFISSHAIADVVQDANSMQDQQNTAYNDTSANDQALQDPGVSRDGETMGEED